MKKPALPTKGARGTGAEAEASAAKAGPTRGAIADDNSVADDAVTRPRNARRPSPRRAGDASSRGRSRGAADDEGAPCASSDAADGRRRSTTFLREDRGATGGTRVWTSAWDAARAMSIPISRARDPR
jgi:hypothetical protein